MLHTGENTPGIDSAILIPAFLLLRVWHIKLRWRRRNRLMGRLTTSLLSGGASRQSLATGEYVVIDQSKAIILQPSAERLDAQHWL